MPRRGRRGNAKQRLQKQLGIQRELERELEQLNQAQDQQTAAKEIIKIVRDGGSDPMLSPDNPFLEVGNGGCCQIL